LVGFNTRYSDLISFRFGGLSAQPNPRFSGSINVVGWVDQVPQLQGVTMMVLARPITGHAWPQNRQEANKLIEEMKAMQS
jgi:hypothetical protein